MTVEDALREIIEKLTVRTIIDVRDFGAIGDGIVDDTTAFELAMAFAKEKNDKYKKTIEFLVEASMRGEKEKLE